MDNISGIDLAIKNSNTDHLVRTKFNIEEFVESNGHHQAFCRPLKEIRRKIKKELHQRKG